MNHIQILKNRPTLIILGVTLIGIGWFVFEKMGTAKPVPTGTSEEGEISLIYFYSEAMGTSTVVKKCPATKDINWELANVALSDYMEYGAGSTTKEFGSAEIQRNFEENCERNMKIYNDMISKNPEL